MYLPGTRTGVAQPTGQVGRWRLERHNSHAARALCSARRILFHSIPSIHSSVCRLSGCPSLCLCRCLRRAHHVHYSARCSLVGLREICGRACLPVYGQCCAACTYIHTCTYTYADTDTDTESKSGGRRKRRRVLDVWTRSWMCMCMWVWECECEWQVASGE